MFAKPVKKEAKRLLKAFEPIMKPSRNEGRDLKNSLTRALAQLMDADPGYQEYLVHDGELPQGGAYSYSECSRAHTFIADYLRRVKTVMSTAGCSEDVIDDTLLYYIAHRFPHLLFPFLGRKGLGKHMDVISSAQLRTHTLVAGDNDLSMQQLLFACNASAFRSGNGGIWCTTPEHQDFVVNLLKADGERHGYADRLHLIDFRPMAEADGVADRSGIKSALDLNLTGNAFQWGPLLSGESRLSADRQTPQPGYEHMLRLLIEALALKYGQATPQNLQQALPLDQLIEFTFGELGFNAKWDPIRDYLSSLPGMPDWRTDSSINTNLDVPESAYQAHGRAIMTTVEVLHTLTHMIGAAGPRTTRFDSCLDSQHIIIAVLPGRESLEARLAANILRQMLTPRLSAKLSVPAASYKIIPDQFAARPAHTPVILAHPVFSEIKGMGVVSAQFRALGSAVFRLETDLIHAAEEAACVRANSGNYLFRRQRHWTPHLLLKALTGKNEAHRLQAAVEVICHHRVPFFSSVGNPDALFVSNDYGVPIKL